MAIVRKALMPMCIQLKINLVQFISAVSLYLQEDSFIKRFEEMEVDVATYVCSVLDQMSASSMWSCEQPLS